MAAAKGACLVYVPDGLDRDAVFAGRRLVERSVAVASAAGLDATLVQAPHAAGLEAPVGHVAPGEHLAIALASPVVLLRCDAACSPGTLRDLLASPLPRPCLVDDDGRVA